MTKAHVYSNRKIDYNSVTDRQFEEIISLLYSKKIEANVIDYDKAYLMPGVGENGRDVILSKSGKISGIVQCKKEKTNFSDKALVEELVKVTLHIIDNIELYASKIDYTIATSSGLTKKSIELLATFSAEFLNQTYDLVPYIKFFRPNLEDYSELKENVIAQISNMSISKYIPTEIDKDILVHKDILERYFDIQKVIDVETFEKVKDELMQKIDSKSNISGNVENFIRQYQVNAVEKLNVINFIGFDIHRHRQKPSDVELQELFVAPLFSKKILKDKEHYIEPDIKVNKIFEENKNLIILGDPGAGKSLLVKYLITQVLQKNHDNINRKYHEYIPFRIELRKYNERREGVSILKYLSEIFSTEYNCKISEEELDYLFSTRKVLLFFDGLDEIFNLSHKTKVKELIELFIISYDNTRCIVTSRFIGYHDIKFKDKSFSEYSIQPFENYQIQDLVTKFYFSQYTNSEKRNKHTQECLKQLERDVDTELKSNPLILTLILILASNNIIIPDSKLEIYEACTKTLVESLDAVSKELKFEIPVKNKRATFSHLAYWQYELSSSNKQITFEKALKCLTAFILDRKESEEFSEAQEKATKFLNYAENRSIYFDNNFTHKTFLEYYTADYLYINFLTKANGNAKRKLLAIIKKYLENPFWYIVFELLFNRIDKEQFDNELLDEIITKQLDSESLDVYYFLISNVHKIENLSNHLKREIFTNTIKLCISGKKLIKNSNDYFYEEKSILGKIALAICSANEHKLFLEAIQEICKDPKADVSELYHFLLELISLIDSLKLPVDIKFIDEGLLEKLCCDNLFLFSSSYVKRNRHDYLSIIQRQIDSFGIESIFTVMKYKYRENTMRLPTIEIVLLDCIDQQKNEEFKNIYALVRGYFQNYEDVISEIATLKYNYYQKKENLEKALRSYLKIDNDEIKGIILKCISNTNAITRRRYSEIKHSFKPTEIKILDKVFNK
jgi:GTPase SAR1 family protein